MTMTSPAPACGAVRPGDQPAGPAAARWCGNSAARRSVSRPLRAVARRLVAARRQGTQVVAVLSAMGGTTDELARQAYSLSAEPQPRELDALLGTGEMMSCALAAMAIHDLGERAVSLTGAQAGIITDNAHGNARLRHITPHRITQALDQGAIVLVAGFQGVSADGDLTTLGRGVRRHRDRPRRRAGRAPLRHLHRRARGLHRRTTTILSALETSRIHPHLITCTPSRVTCHILAGDVGRAAQILHDAFQLHTSEGSSSREGGPGAGGFLSERDDRAPSARVRPGPHAPVMEAGHSGGGAWGAAARRR